MSFRRSQYRKHSDLLDYEKRMTSPYSAATPILSQVRVRCPTCGEAVQGLERPACETCGWAARVDAGIPVLLSTPARAGHDELQHSSHGHKSAQRAHFDHSSDARFETVRPHGAPGLYRFLLDRKFQRAIEPIKGKLCGSTALVVCGGSGMDAEYLSRAGAQVISSDLSLGAAKRAKARSDHYDLDIASVVADVEHLPFPDRSLELVAVHDGLHHLSDPYVGLAEMARVARRWVLITEPAQANMTKLAIRSGLALEREEAGNRVARLEACEVTAFLEDRGFAILRAERYAMYYPHYPGTMFRLLSLPVVLPIVSRAWQAANAAFGRFGNKLVVVGERAT